MPLEIRSRWDSTKILYSGEAATLQDLVATAVKGGATLRGANLRGADLRDATLRDANLYEATLRGADLRGATLYEATLRDADLYGADLYGADLYGATLRGANLYDATLRGANLRGADLYGADLRGADLRGADLYGATLRDATLRDANLRGAKNIWQSHEILSEILWRAAADNPAREQLAAWIGRKTGWCWKDWLAVEHPEREWALAELRKWVVAGDNVPQELLALDAKEGTDAT